MIRDQRRQSTTKAIVLGCAALLSFITVFNQVKTLGLSWQEEHYTARLEAVVNGMADSPWQYRVLSDALTLGVCRFFAWIGAPRSVGLAMVFVRLAQNTAIFILAVAYYRRLGIPVYTALLGIMALAWGMTHSNFNSDLAVNTYTDVLLYLCAGIAITGRRPAWILPITVLGALNRETSGLIPIMLLAASVEHAGGLPARNTPDVLAIPGTGLFIQRGILAVGLLSLAAYTAVFLGLRIYFGVRHWIPYSAGVHQGWELLAFNLRYDRTWGHLAGTLGIMPILALAARPWWRRPLGAFAWAIVPAWLVIHLCLSALAESRVLLVPQVLVFIPAALCGLIPPPDRIETPIPQPVRETP